MHEHTQKTVAVQVQRVGSTQRADQTGREDCLAREEPLEIRLAHRERMRRSDRSVAVTMRTPGNDSELATGFLLGEGLLPRLEHVRAIRELPEASTVRVELVDEVRVDLKRLARNFYTTSSCGMCGKSSLAAIEWPIAASDALPEGFVIPAQMIQRLPERLRAAQPIFERTGGLHAAALFSQAGELIVVREDVGRHNAVDKVIGSRFLAGAMPISDAVLFVSGRASFELVQKAVVAGIPMLAAVGAPSSLAVELAQRFNMTLVGFVRDERFNIYCGGQRISA
ncbi:MAG: formate dehydrogenase accessory sulfurtransferase FdhD [Polyangiales bacterium]